MNDGERGARPDADGAGSQGSDEGWVLPGGQAPAGWGPRTQPPPAWQPTQQQPAWQPGPPPPVWVVPPAPPAWGGPAASSGSSGPSEPSRRSGPMPWDWCSLTGAGVSLLGPLAAAAVPLGIAGLVRTEGRRRRGRPAAVAALVAATLWAVVFGGWVAVDTAGSSGRVAADEARTWTAPTPTPEPTPEPTPTPRASDDDTGKMVPVGLLRAGQCVLDPEGGSDHDVTLLTLVDCGRPHTFEVLAVRPLKVTGKYPGGGAVSDMSVKACMPSYRAVLERHRKDRRRYGLFTFEPLAQSWAEGRAEVTCLLGSSRSPKLLPGGRLGTSGPET